MLSYEEALARTLKDLSTLYAEGVRLAEAGGRVLGEDLHAPFDLPPFDYSERDGYALAAADLTGDGPFRLTVTQTLHAGRAGRALGAGEAARIMTGAALPAAADAVVMQENCLREGDFVTFGSKPAPGAYLRRRGEDLRAGTSALQKGTRLGAGALTLAAMLGQAELRVARRPRVRILPTGDELRAAGEPLGPGEIYEANAQGLAFLATQAGATVHSLQPVRDEPIALALAIDAALKDTDLLVTIGGVSVGERDYVRSALAEAQVALDFWKIAVKPGKPLALGRRGATRVLALPGNPASALVTFALFGLPLLRALQGARQPSANWRKIATLEPPPVDAAREQFLRVRLQREGEAGEVAVLLRQQASGAATSLAESDGLLRIPAGADGRTAFGFAAWSDL